jgi:OmcA/MtrC family decaheme c-type cytochrome
VDYALQPATGRITEVTEFGAGAAVLVSYTTHFTVPGAHGPPLNDSPGLTEEHGEWRGKTLVPGTYSLSLLARTSKFTFFAGETNVYPIVAEARRVEFQVQDAPVARPYDLIGLPAACNDCHQDLRFHAGEYRGFDACLGCHGTAGAEDRPRYVAGNAPDSPGVEVNFRQLLHKIHMGVRLDGADSYFVVGEGDNPYPFNFQVSVFDTILFPAFPGRTMECAKCHGPANTAWMLPAARDHPTEQDIPVRSWRAACMSCHDSPSALAHGDVNTAPNGVESCAVCHGPSGSENVELVHRSR